MLLQNVPNGLLLSYRSYRRSKDWERKWTMKRRDILTSSVGAMMASAVGVSAFGQPSSAPSQSEDRAAARRYDRERRFAETAFGRIAHIDRGKGPAVLFLHGFPLSSFPWRGAI